MSFIKLSYISIWGMIFAFASTFHCYSQDETTPTIITIKNKPLVKDVSRLGINIGRSSSANVKKPRSLNF